MGDARLDVRDFGAVGDGETDDGPAFARAMDAVPAGGGELYAPGTYRLGSPIELPPDRPVRLTGGGGELWPDGETAISARGPGVGHAISGLTVRPGPRAGADRPPGTCRPS